MRACVRAWPCFALQDIPEADRYYLSDEYKREVVEQMGTSQLIDTIMINPTVTLRASHRDTGFTASYTFEPLSNMVSWEASFVRLMLMAY